MAQASSTNNEYRILENSDAFKSIGDKSLFGPVPLSWMPDVVALTRSKISLHTASLEAMRGVQQHNSKAFWGIFERYGHVHRLTAFFAQLLLNQAGHIALLERSLDLKSPRIDHLTADETTARAVYMWAIVAEGKAAIMHRLLAEQFSHLGHLPHYGTPATEAGLKEARYIRMTPVTERDNRVGGLFVMPTRKSPNVTVKIAATAQDFLECQAIRATVFMGEQQCPYEEEFDGNDYCALHVLGHINDAPVATLRMRFFADLVKLERMAVMPQWRKTTVKQQLVFLAFEIARRKGYRRCYAHAEKRLLPFWARFGFEVYPRNTTLRFSDHEYVEIVRDLEPHPESLSLNSDPMVLNRLEGSWDIPGVLDRSARRAPTNAS